MLDVAIDTIRGIRARFRSSDDQDYLRIVADPTGEAARYRAEAERLALRDVPYYEAVHASGKPLPILDKDMIRKRGEWLVSRRIETLGPVRVNTSGGSTGEPVRLLQDGTYDRFVGYALDYWYREVIGVDPARMRKLIIWGSERDLCTWSGDWKKKLRGVLSQTRYVNAFKLDGGALSDCVETINAFKPDMIRGYANSLLELATYVRDRSIEIHSPLFLVSSAETLSAEARETIQDVFDRQLFDLYGSRECAAMAGECRAGRLHVFDFNHAIEVVDDHGEPVEEGSEGRVLVSQLHNRAMPLLRYEIGDVAVRGPATCGCGAPQPTLLRIAGRVSDGFLTLEGGVVHGEYFTHLFYFRDWVKQFQVIQEAVDDIRILLVLKPGEEFLPGDERDIAKKIRKAMGASCRVRFELVDEIPRTPQGKFLYTLSRLTGGRGG